MTNNEIDTLIAEKIMGLKVLGEWSCYSVEGSTCVDFDGHWKDSGYDSIRPVYVYPNWDGVIESDDKLIYGVPYFVVDPVPGYSLDINLAFSIVPFLEKEKWLISIIRKCGDKEPYDKIRWAVDFRLCDSSKEAKYACGVHDNLAMAICIAAMQTVENKPLGESYDS